MAQERLPTLPKDIWSTVISFLGKNAREVLGVSKEFNELAYINKLKNDFKKNQLPEGKTAKSYYFELAKKAISIEKEKVIRYLMVLDMQRWQNIERAYSQNTRSLTNTMFNIFGFGRVIEDEVKKSEDNIFKIYEAAKKTELYVEAREIRYRNILTDLLYCPNLVLDNIKASDVKSYEDEAIGPYVDELSMKGLTEEEMRRMAIYDVIDAMCATKAIRLMERIISLFPEFVSFALPHGYKGTLLARATFFNHEELVKLLLEKGADPNQQIIIPPKNNDSLPESFRAINFAVIHLNVNDDKFRERAKKIISLFSNFGAVLPSFEEFKDINFRDEGYLEAEELMKSFVTQRT